MKNMWAEWSESLEMSLNVSGLNLNTGFNSGVVTGTELERVSQEIFSAAPRAAEVGTDLSAKLNRFQQEDVGINFFEKGVDINFTKQVASLKTGFDVQLSNDAMANIHALNTQAAKTQTSSIQSNMHKHVEGKLHIQTDAEFANADLKSIFAMPNTPQLFNAGGLGKDRKGSSPFAYTNSNSQEKSENKEGLSIVA